MAEPIYTDVDISFKAHPVSGDLIKLNDVNAVKRSIKNIIMSIKYDSPFNPRFGVGIGSFLFDIMTPVTSVIMERKIREQLYEYESRIEILSLTVEQDNEYSLIVEIVFKVIGFNESQSLTIPLERTR